MILSSVKNKLLSYFFGAFHALFGEDRTVDGRGSRARAGGDVGERGDRLDLNPEAVKASLTEPTT